MKSYLNLLFLFCFTIFSAQNKDSNSSNQKVTETKATILNIDNDKSQSYNSALLSEKKEDHLTDEKKVKNLDYKKAPETKSDTEKSISDQNINIVQEINAVLNYKVNRVWRKDLYCLVCIKNSDPGRAA